MAAIAYVAWLSMAIQMRLRLLRDLLAKKLMSGEAHIVQIRLKGCNEREVEVKLMVNFESILTLEQQNAASNAHTLSMSNLGQYHQLSYRCIGKGRQRWCLRTILHVPY